MFSRKVQQALEIFDVYAEEEGLPRYKTIENELRMARWRRDKRAQSRLLQDIGSRLSSISKVVRTIEEQEREARLLPSPAELLEQAISLFFDSLDAAKVVSDESRQKLALNGLGDCHYQLNEFEKALQYLTSALDLCRMPEDATLRFDALQEAGGCLSNLENDEKALKYYQDALEIARSLDDPFQVAMLSGKVAIVLSNLKRYDEALSQYEESNNLLISIGNDENLQKKISIHKNNFDISYLPNVIAYANEQIARIRELQSYNQSLADLPKASSIRYRHANYYLKKLGQINTEYKNSLEEDRAVIITRFEAEWEQIRQGQRWTANYIDQSDIVTQLCIDYALTAVSLLDARISSQERVKWNAVALTAAEKKRDVETQMKLLTNIGYNYIDLGNANEAQKSFEQALHISQALNHQRGEEYARIGLSEVYRLTGQSAEALQMVESGRSLAAEMQEEDLYLTNLMMIYLDTGKYDQALEIGERGLTVAREAQDAPQEAQFLGNLGLVYYSLGQYQTALEYHLGALTISRKLRERRWEIDNLTNAGSAYLELQQFERAQECYDTALNITRELDDHSREENCLGNLGILYTITGRYDTAIEKYDEARTMAVKSQHKAGEAQALHGLGNIFLKCQDYDKSISHFNQALAIEQEINRPEYQSTNLYSLGTVYSLRGQFDIALMQYEKSLDIAKALDNKLLEGRTHLGKSAVFWRVGKSKEALTSARQARDLFKEIESVPDIEAAELAMSQVAKSFDVQSSDTDQAQVLRLMLSWTQIPTINPTQSKAFLLEHQEQLLTENAENILRLLAINEPDNRNLQSRLGLLRECRTDGIESTYEKYSLELLASITMNFDNWRKTPAGEGVTQKIIDWTLQPDKISSKRFLETNQEDLLSTNSTIVLSILSQDNSSEAKHFRPFLDLHNLCRKQGIDMAHANFDTLAWHSDMMELISEWMHIADWNSRKQFIRRHADDLLTDTAERVLLLIAKEDPEQADMANAHRILLRACRRNGIDIAVTAQAQLDKPRSKKHLANIFIRWVESPTLEASKKYLIKHKKDLLTEWAVYLAKKIAREAPDFPMVAKHVSLMEASIELGIDMAYDTVDAKDLDK